jgi:RNA polymerase sigma factor (sigma-70 family)
VTDSRKSDLELVETFKHGDVRGFNELVRRYQEKVYWIARRMVSTHEHADDITQDVFIRVYGSLKAFRGDSSLYTWLYRITTNVALNSVRKQKVREFLRLEDMRDSIAHADEGPSEQLDQKELDHVLNNAIKRLPPKQKLVFTLRYYDEMPYEEMAKILKKSVGGLKANYFHALKKIQTVIQKELAK